MLLAEPAADAGDGFLDVRARVEGREPEVALAGRTEAGAGRADDLDLGEQAIEELPGAGAVARTQPQVGRVDATEHGEAGGAEALAQEPRILHVERDLLAGLGEPGGRVRCRRAALDDVGGAVELGRVAARPQRVERGARTVGRGAGDGLGDDQERAAHAGEAGPLGEAAQLDGTVARAVDLVERVGETSKVRALAGGCLDVARGRTGEPASTTGCRQCQRAYVGSTTAQSRRCRARRRSWRATKRRRTRTRPAVGPAQARRRPGCTGARAARGRRAPGRNPRRRRPRCDGRRTGTTARRWRTPGATARPTGPGRYASSRSAWPRRAVARRGARVPARGAARAACWPGRTPPRNEP